MNHKLSYFMFKDVCVTAMIDHKFVSLSAVQMYDLSYVHLYPSHSIGYIRNSRSDQLPDGVIAQSIEHCTRFAEVMGSSPVQALSFFRL